MAMTVLHQLLDFHGIPANRIGRLEAATESEIDGSKSFKSHLMQVLQDEDPEATDIEGCDCFHDATLALLRFKTQSTGSKVGVGTVASPSLSCRMCLSISEDLLVRVLALGQ